MDNEQRHKRLQLLIKKLNKERRKQSKKIDILCNDFISAQKDFIMKLRTISFMAGFYESIIGITDLSDLLSNAARLIKAEHPDVSITFFLRQDDNFEIHMFECEHPIAFARQHIENCFSHELMDSICKSNKICTLDDMFAMGLQGNLAGLNTVSVLTIPLSEFGSSLGFMMICCSSENRLTMDKVDNISSVICGVCRAIVSCRAVSRDSN